MIRVLSGFFLALLPFFAHAQDSTANAPAEETNMIGTVIFIVLFLGFCLGFVWMVWRSDRNEKRRKKETEERGQRGTTEPKAH